jgi:hypothetical protein
VAPDEPAAGLYDFLYRDPVRIPSFYAQLFGGRLSTVELTTAAREATERAGKVSAMNVLSGEAKGIEDRTTGRKEVIDATDLLAGDVLSALVGKGTVREDFVEAPSNALILVSGEVTFVDHSALKIGKIVLEAAIKDEEKKKGHQKNRDAIRGLEMVAKLIDTITLPSMFVMRTAGGPVIAGQVRDEGMAEPISAHYFKHGASTLRDVFAVGVKESDGSPIELPQAQFFTAAMGMAQALGGLLFPPDAVRITPIALFRKHF